VTSTEAAAADVAAARAAGANYYLVKPVDREQLVEFARILCGVAA
jgi:two-component system chemotaxis response regulator CheY